MTASKRPPFLTAVENAMLRTTVRNSGPRQHGFDQSRWNGLAIQQFIEREFNATMELDHCKVLLKEIREKKF